MGDRGPDGRRDDGPRGLSPGWYLLIFVVVYALGVTLAWGRSVQQLRDARATIEQWETGDADGDDRVEAPTPRRGATAASGGLWFPVPGARLPADDAHLPGAVRAYRQGVLQGFDFYDGDAGVPIPFGAPVIAAQAGTVVRADLGYTELSPERWEALLAEVAGGADDEQLDALRGRQVWIETADGTVLRYAHLSGIRPGLAQGASVYRGQVVGYVGNSGTDAGVAGTARGARLHFEIWDDGSFFGEGLSPDEVRIAAASRFVGP